MHLGICWRQPVHGLTGYFSGGPICALLLLLAPLPNCLAIRTGEPVLTSWARKHTHPRERSLGAGSWVLDTQLARLYLRMLRAAVRRGRISSLCRAWKRACSALVRNSNGEGPSCVTWHWVPGCSWAERLPQESPWEVAREFFGCPLTSNGCGLPRTTN